jgi:hypothetical protein
VTRNGIAMCCIVMTNKVKWQTFHDLPLTAFLSHSFDNNLSSFLRRRDETIETALRPLYDDQHELIRMTGKKSTNLE